MTVIQGPTVLFGAEFTGLEGATAGLDGLRRSTERARDQFGRFVRAGDDAAAALSRLGGDGAKALDETAKAALQINPALEQMLVGVNKASQGFKDFAGKQASGLMEALADDIEQTTDGFDRLRGAVDATGDTLRIFGKRGVEIANAIEDISDPTRRATLALRELNRQTNPGLLDRFNRGVSDMGAELELMRIRMGAAGKVIGGVVKRVGAMGRAGVAAAAAVGAAVMGGMVAAFGLALEGNKRLKKSFDGLILSAKKLVSTAAQIVIGFAGIETHAIDATSAIDGITASMITNQGEIRVFAATLIEATADIGEQLANMAMVVRIALFDVPRFVFRGFQLMADAIPGIFHRVRASILETMAGLVLDVALMAKKAGADELAAHLRDVWEGTRNAAIAADQAAKGYGRSFAATGAKLDAEMQGLKDTLSEIDSLAERARNRARDVRLGNVADVKDVDTTGLDEKPEKAKREGVSTGDGERGRRIKELIKEFSPDRYFVGQTITNVDPRVEVLADLNKNLAEGQILGANFANAMASADLASAALANKGMSLLTQTLGESINLMVDLGSVTATTLGQFAAGVGTLSQFGDTVLDMFGGLASSLGDFYIKTGMASLWLNPAAGAGMIAGGLALKALGGFLGGKGSGNRGAGRSSGGTAAAVDPSRFMRPERDTEPSVTNLKVVILGEEIERPVTRFIDDVARRGGFRNLATRT